MFLLWRKDDEKILLAAAVAGLVLGATAQADVSFGTYKDGSTLTWQTLVNTHRDRPEITTEFTVIDAGSAKMRGIYNGGDAGDSAMYTALTLSAGDKVTFDWYLSNNGNNIPDYYGGNWVGDATFQFKTVVESGSWNLATERFVSNSGSDHHWYSDGGSWYDNVADLNTGLHVEYIFGETDYTLNITSLVDPLKTSTLTREYVNGGTVADIQCFRVGIWDSEQDVTIANFAGAPEPAPMVLLGLGGLLLGRKRV